MVLSKNTAVISRSILNEWHFKYSSHTAYIGKVLSWTVLVHESLFEKTSLQGRSNEPHNDLNFFLDFCLQATAHLFTVYPHDSLSVPPGQMSRGLFPRQHPNTLVSLKGNMIQYV